MDGSQNNYVQYDINNNIDKGTHT